MGVFILDLFRTARNIPEKRCARHKFEAHAVQNFGKKINYPELRSATRCMHSVNINCMRAFNNKEAFLNLAYQIFGGGDKRASRFGGSTF